MENLNSEGRTVSALTLYLAPVPALLLAGIILALHLVLPTGPTRVLGFEPPLLLPILNTIFLFFASGLVAYVAMRSYLLSGSTPILFLGCGVLTLSLGSLVAGWLSGPSGPNANITVFSLSALFASILHVAGSILNLRQDHPTSNPSLRKRRLALGYLGVLLIVVLLAVAAVAGILPPFARGREPTLARAVAQQSTLILFSASFLFMIHQFMRKRSPFLYWYSLALLLLALGMLSFVFARVAADPLIWAGRSARYLAGIYLVLAVVLERRDARSKGVQVDEAVADLFSASRVYWQDILATVSDAIVSFDKGWRILQWNQAAERILGYSRAEAIGGKMDLIMPDAVALAEQPMPSEEVAEMELRRKDGNRFIAEVSVSSRALSSGPVTTFVVRDVTRRKMAERALEELNQSLEQRVAARTAELVESERRWATTLTSIGDAVIAIDIHGRISFMNAVAENLTGWKSSEALQKQVELVFRIVNEQSRLDAENPITRALREGMIVGLANHTVLVRRDGTEIPIDDSAAPIKDADGTVLGVVLIFRDIIERKRGEEALKKAHSDLQNHARMLEETNRELEGFAYTISHDLRAPLRAINGFARMLSADYGHSLDEEGKRWLAVVSTSAVKMGLLIDELLAFSRAGRTAMSVARIDMNRLVAQVVETLKTSEAGARSGLRVAELPPAFGDPSLIRQVFVNLLENAVKFSMKRADPRIEVGSFERDGEQVYFVKDNGVGFDMNYYGKLFGVFQRLVTERDFEGTGVGLAIVQRLIIRHGGRVWAEGKLREGATFYFTLPGKDGPAGGAQ